MKKIITVLLLIALMISVTGCGTSGIFSDDKNKTENEQIIAEHSNNTRDSAEEATGHEQDEVQSSGNNFAATTEKLNVSLPVEVDDYCSLLSNRLTDASNISHVNNSLSKSYKDYDQGYGAFIYSYGINNCASLHAYTFREEVTQFEVVVSPQVFSPEPQVHVTDLINVALLPATVFFSNNDTQQIIDTIKNEMSVYDTSCGEDAETAVYWYVNGDFELMMTATTWKTGYFKGKTTVSIWGQISGKHHLYTISGWPVSQEVSTEEALKDEEALYSNDTTNTNVDDVKERVLAATSIVSSSGGYGKAGLTHSFR